MPLYQWPSSATPRVAAICRLVALLAAASAACSGQIGDSVGADNQRDRGAGAGSAGSVARSPGAGPGLPGGATASGADGTGNAGTAGVGGVDLPSGTPKPGPTTLRRLTNREYRNTVAALFSLATPPTIALEADPISKAGFDNFASDLAVSATSAGQYAELAATLAKTLSVPACVPPSSEAVCAGTFIAAFGKRAFRRPLTPAEIQRYQALYADERARSSHIGGIIQVVETLLQSPKFLYRFELGTPAGGAQRRLTAYEIASELSYLFTASMPDDALFAAAEANQVQTPAQITTQGRRLLKLPAARNAIRELLTSYAGLLRFEELVKSTETYPAFTTELRTAMLQETNRFIDAVLWEADGTFKTLMTAPYSYVNRTLARFYGVANGPQGTTLVKTALNPAQRSGLLTHPAVLAAHSKADESFPILRGKFVRVGLLCQPLPAPPNVVPSAPQPVKTATTRERFAQHAADPACSGCHRLIDPLGFGLENYDGIGQYRDTENGKPVDASGVLTGTVAADGPYRGGVELAKKLADSAEARQCLALQAYRWAFGRFEDEGERELVNGIEKSLAAGMDIRELLVAITATPSFVLRTQQ